MCVLRLKRLPHYLVAFAQESAGKTTAQELGHQKREESFNCPFAVSSQSLQKYSNFYLWLHQKKASLCTIGKVGNGVKFCMSNLIFASRFSSSRSFHQSIAGRSVGFSWLSKLPAFPEGETNAKRAKEEEEEQHQQTLTFLSISCAVARSLSFGLRGLYQSTQPARGGKQERPKTSFLLWPFATKVGIPCTGVNKEPIATPCRPGSER